MKETVYRGQVRYLQLCDPRGQLDTDLLEVKLDTDLLARTFDRRAVQLQRQGRLGTYASSRGQEACQVGCAMALEASDFVFPSYRETPLQLARGASPEDLLTYWAGDERGSRHEGDAPVFPVSIPVGSQVIHAVGAARAKPLRGDPMLAVACFIGSLVEGLEGNDGFPFG